MDEETKALTSTLNSFLDYNHTAQLNVVKVRREKLNQLKTKYLCDNGESVNRCDDSDQVNYYKLASKYIEPLLENLTEGIENNSFFLETVAQTAKIAFDAPEDEKLWEESSISEISKVVSMLGQISREWSIEGIQERACSMGKVITEIENLFPELEEGTFEFNEFIAKMDLGNERVLSDELRHQITRNRAGVNIVIPGCGLGRLPLELAARGFAAQGNEVSFSMLFTSNFILNNTSATNEYRLNPWIHSFSHVRDRAYQTRDVLVPDIHPAEFLTRREKVFGKPAGELTMIAGSFDEVYPAKVAARRDVTSSVMTEPHKLEHHCTGQHSEDEGKEIFQKKHCEEEDIIRKNENTVYKEPMDCNHNIKIDIMVASEDKILENALNKVTLESELSQHKSMHKVDYDKIERNENKVIDCCERHPLCLKKSKNLSDSTSLPPLFPTNDDHSIGKRAQDRQSFKSFPDENADQKGENNTINEEILKVDVIATVFFIDTSPNIFKTLDTIAKTLVKGGYWINFGPLLWHYEHHIPAFEYPSCEGPMNSTLDSNLNKFHEDVGVSSSGHSHSYDRDFDDRTAGLELSLSEIFDVLPNYGLRIIKQESRIPTCYAIDTMSMRGNMYNCEYWVAIKEV